MVCPNYFFVSLWPSSLGIQNLRFRLDKFFEFSVTDIEFGIFQMKTTIKFPNHGQFITMLNFYMYQNFLGCLYSNRVQSLGLAVRSTLIIVKWDVQSGLEIAREGKENWKTPVRRQTYRLCFANAAKASDLSAQTRRVWTGNVPMGKSEGVSTFSFADQMPRETNSRWKLTGN